MIKTDKPSFVKNADSTSDDVSTFGKIWFSYFAHIFYSIESIPDFSMNLDSLDSTLQNWLIMSYSKNQPLKRYGLIFVKISRFFRKFENFENFKIVIFFILLSEIVLFCPI